MANLRYETINRYDGPWLLDESCLRSLDAIFEEIRAAFEEQRERDVAKLVLESPHNQYSLGGAEEALFEALRIQLESNATSHIREVQKGWVFFLPNDLRTEYKTIEEAVRSPELANHAPIRFSVKVSYGVKSASVEIDSYSGCLSTRAWPEEDALTQDAVHQLRSWAEGSQPARWVRWWKSIGSWLWMALPLPIWAVSIALTTRSVDSRAYSDMVREAQILVKNGVTPANEAKAVELLLKGTFNLEGPRYQSFSFAGWHIVLLAVIAISIVGLSVVPKPAIGLGAGTKVLRRRARWVKFVGYTIPSVVGTSLLLPWLISWVERFVKGSG